LGFLLSQQHFVFLLEFLFVLVRIFDKRVLLRLDLLEEVLVDELLVHLVDVFLDVDDVAVDEGELDDHVVLAQSEDLAV